MTSLATNPKTAGSASLHNADPPIWFSHGTSPTIEMRHTIDDCVQVATHVSYLPFRAVMHRNRDGIVLFSESACELKPRLPAAENSEANRVVVLTDQHLYVLTPPSKAFFAPAAGGGCFALSAFARFCVVEKTANVVFQFVNGIIALRLSGEKEAARLAQIVFSATGVPKEEVSEHDLQLATHADHFARSGANRVMRLAATSSAAASGSDAMSGSTGAMSRRNLLGVGVGMSNKDAACLGAGSPRKILTGGVKGAGDAAAVEKMLQFVLETSASGTDGSGGPGGESSYLSNFPDRETQTENEVADGSCNAVVQTVNRATSPIRFVASDPYSGAPGAGKYHHHFEEGNSRKQQQQQLSRTRSSLTTSPSFARGGGGGIRAHHSHMHDTTDNQDAAELMSDSTSGGFDHNEVWRSLYPGAGGGSESVSKRSTPQRAVSFGDPSSPCTRSARPSRHTSASHLPSAEMPLFAESGVPTGGQHVVGTNSLFATSAVATREEPTTAEGSVVLTEEGFHESVDGSDDGADLTTPTSSAAKLGGEGAGASASAHHQQSYVQFDSFLGVLSVYRSELVAKCGIDSVKQLTRVDVKELESIMDKAGIMKGGHRLLLASKVSLARQSSKKK